MTAALAVRHPGVVVSDVRLGTVRQGTNARARANLTYGRGEGPPSVFVKRAGRLVPRLALRALGALDTEARRRPGPSCRCPTRAPTPAASIVCTWRRSSSWTT
jgi:hypothetical protein